MTEAKEKIVVVTPEGTLVHESLWEKDLFDEKATASYKIEMAFGPDDLEEVENALADAADAKWGAGAGDEYMDGKYVDPLLDGDVLLKRREEKGKSGDAYEGKVIIRAHTIFNLNGHDAPGGICVLAPDVSVIEPAARADVYPGCRGKAKLVVDTYIDSSSQKRALMFYLQAFQKTADGEPLRTAADHAASFKPVGGGEGGGGKRRRARG